MTHPMFKGPMLKKTNINYLTADEIIFIKENLNNVDEILHNSHDLNDVLWELDEWIIAYGYDEDWSFNDEGWKAQKMYDDIYCRNIAEYE